MPSVVAWTLAGLFLLSGCVGSQGGNDLENRQAPGASQEEERPHAVYSEPVKDPAKPCLSGRVMDDESLPIYLARLTLVDLEKSVLTDAGGNFAFCDLAPDTYALLAEADGYFSTMYNISVPQSSGILRVELTRVPPREPFHDTVDFATYYTLGMATVDNAISGTGNTTNCNPCTYSYAINELPDFALVEATWDRSVTFTHPPEAVPVKLATLYHIYRAGAPYDEGRNIHAGRGDPGPLREEYVRGEITAAQKFIGADVENDRLFWFSIKLTCGGWAPCVSQRMDGHITHFYDFSEIPADFSAIPEE